MSRLKPGEDGRHVTFCRICEQLSASSLLVGIEVVVAPAPSRGGHQVRAGELSGAAVN